MEKDKDKDNLIVSVVFDQSDGSTITKIIKNVHGVQCEEDGRLVLISREYGCIAAFAAGSWSRMWVDEATDLTRYGKEKLIALKARHDAFYGRARKFHERIDQGSSGPMEVVE